MPLSSLLKSAAGTCPFCHQKVGILSREHSECRRTFQTGWKGMVRLARDAAKSHEFNPNSLPVSLAEIANRSYGDDDTVNQALEEGWKQGVSHAMADGIICPVRRVQAQGVQGQTRPGPPARSPGCGRTRHTPDRVH